LRQKLLAAIDTLFNRQPDLDLAPTAIAGLATNIHSIFSRAADMIESIDACPVLADAEEAVRSGSPESLEEFCDTAAYSVKRAEGRENSHGALRGLAPYMDEVWITARWAAIDRDETNVDAITA